MRGLGIDAVDIGRFRAALERTPSLRSRLFTHDELQSLSAKADQVSSLAARFAVREAAMKALGVGLGAFDLHDVSVAKLSSGQPTLRVTGRAEQLAKSKGVTSWQVSISHTDTVAVAVVAAE
ncbi:MAG: holo-[acyl-carrier-protein] synthase [Actinomycetota bacterium]|jgi:holo-[acyl-carrier protein] synthase